MYKKMKWDFWFFGESHQTKIWPENVEVRERCVGALPQYSVTSACAVGWVDFNGGMPESKSTQLSFTSMWNTL